MSSRKRIDRLLVGVVRTLFAFAILAIGFLPLANADTIYTYTGNMFDSFKGDFECPPVCRITGSFTVAQPLPANLSFVTISPKFFSVSDGVVTLTPANSHPLIFQPFMLATDATGAITTWDVRITGKQALVKESLSTVNFPGFSEDEVGIPVGALNTNNPGVWSAVTTNTPEPSCLLLLCTGLLSIVGGARVIGRTLGIGSILGSKQLR